MVNRVIVISFILILCVACRSGSQVPSDTIITVMTPTVIPVECKNDLYPESAPQFGQNETIDYKNRQIGLKFIDLVEGSGENVVIPDDKVEVHYTGWLNDGCVFDSTYPRGATAKFRIGKEQVIRGWDLGIPGMKEGGVRRLEISPDLAYGKDGIPGVIPKNSTLFFEVKLVEIIRLVTK